MELGDNFVFYEPPGNQEMSNLRLVFRLVGQEKQ